MRHVLKKVLISICVLCLFVPTAFAQNPFAPEHITDSCYSNTGKITIHIDADVIVPETDCIPIYSADVRLFEFDEVLAMAKAVFGQREYSGDDEFRHEQFGTGDTSYTMDRIYLESSDGYLFQVIQIEDTSRNYTLAEAEYRMPTLEGKTIFSADGDAQLDDDMPDGCMLDHDEARRIADNAVSQFAPEFVCTKQTVMNGYTLIPATEEDISDTQSSDEQAWVFYYSRNLAMPVTFEYSGTLSHYDLDNPMRPTVGDEWLAIVVNDEGIQAMEYDNPHQINGILQEDCELLPFDQIMGIAKAILPLKNAWLEQYYEDIRVNIYEIRLGYMRVISRNTQEFEYIPIWDFFYTEECRQVKDGEIVVLNDTPCESFLTINAIDGTIIDRNYGY